MAVSFIPDGYHSVTPYLVVQDVSRLIEFLKQAFDAEETFRMPKDDGTVMHAEVRIGDSMVMMGEATGDIEPMPASIQLYVENADSVYDRAIQAGASSIREPEDQFYGDRSSGVKDPVGNQWWIVTHKEDVSYEEMTRRMEAMAQA